MISQRANIGGSRPDPKSVLQPWPYSSPARIPSRRPAPLRTLRYVCFLPPPGVVINRFLQMRSVMIKKKEAAPSITTQTRQMIWTMMIQMRTWTYNFYTYCGSKDSISASVQNKRTELVGFLQVRRMKGQNSSTLYGVHVILVLLKYLQLFSRCLERGGAR